MARRRMKTGSSGFTSSYDPRTRVESTERRLLVGVGRSAAFNVGGRGNASMTLLEGASSRSV